jgi:uncharacterized protein (DUF1778 family)
MRRTGTKNDKRITLRLPYDLWKQLRAAAGEEDQSTTLFIVNLLQEWADGVCREARWAAEAAEEWEQEQRSLRERIERQRLLEQQSRENEFRRRLNYHGDFPVTLQLPYTMSRAGEDYGPGRVEVTDLRLALKLAQVLQSNGYDPFTGEPERNK